jgi:hypothetical protein
MFRAAKQLLRTNDEPRIQPPQSLENVLKLSCMRSTANAKPGSALGSIVGGAFDVSVT